ncbi:MAG: hypothetical protein JJU05_11885 [Verrucomicrobia bacterium]|nr:hypothetical protein [Verrucomicrobiota bacterium]
MGFLPISLFRIPEGLQRRPPVGIFAYRVASTLNPKAAARLDTLSSLWTITMFLTVVLG